MPARKKEEQINLLPQKGFQSTTSGRVLAWILSTFRIIVIVTEIIVMIAFLSRFWFDAQNTDLNEKIGQKQYILQSAQEFEVRFKDAQQRLAVLEEINKNNVNPVNLMSNITTYTPSDVLLVKFFASTGKVEIEGITPNEKSIQQFVVNLASDDSLSDVGLSKINTSTQNSNLLIFTVSAELKKAEGS